MKNREIIPDLEKYNVFVDVQNNENLYAITKEEYEKVRTISKGYDSSVEKVPDEFKIKVFRMGLVDDTDPYHDKYDIIDANPIDFPINRYHWTWIQIITKK